MAAQSAISANVGSDELNVWRRVDLAPGNPLAAENRTLAGVAGAGGPYEVGDSVWLNVAVAHVVKRSAGQSVKSHLHPWLELTWVVDGAAELSVEGCEGTQPLAPGDALLVPMHHPHGWKNAGEGPVTFFGIMLEAGASAVSQAELTDAMRKAAERKGYVLRNSSMFQLIAELRREAETRNPGWQGVCQGLLHSLLGLLWRELNDPATLLNSARDTAARAEEDVARIHAAYAFIHAHLAEPLTAECIAAKNGFSLRHLNRLCHAHGFPSIKQTLQNVRLDQARQLLQVTDYSIAKIAELTGFSNADYLGRVFRGAEGMTPTAYRKRK